MFNEKDGDNKKLEIKEKKLIVIKKIEENNLEQEK